MVLQIAILTGPPALFVSLQMFSLAVLAFYGPLAMLLALYAFRRQALEWTALVVGCIPMLLLLRPIFYQNSISVIFFATLVFWAGFQTESLNPLLRNTLAIAFCLAAFVYWWYSFLYTGTYSTNLKALDLVFGGCCVFLLSRFRSYLAASLWGIGISTLFIIGALWSYGIERLGAAEVGMYSLGDPQQIGMAMTLMLLLSLTDEGRWLFLMDQGKWRFVVTACAGIFLLLTTSRTSWLMAAVGMIPLLVSRRQRRNLIGGIVVLAIGAFLAISSSRGEFVLKYFDKTFAANRTLNERTTGRFDMYAKFPSLFWESPIFGHGPGSTGTLYRSYTGEIKVMHSIYLQVGVELGAIGLFVLLSLHGALLHRTILHRAMTKELAPLICALALFLDASAHTTFNAMNGVFLGLALADRSAFQIARTLVPYVDETMQKHIGDYHSVRS